MFQNPYLINMTPRRDTAVRFYGYNKIMKVKHVVHMAMDKMLLIDMYFSDKLDRYPENFHIAFKVR